MNNKESQNLSGVWYAIAAFGLWGVLPLYWKALGSVPAAEIMAHRILWSFIFIFILILFFGKLGELKQVLANRSNLLPALLSSVLITTNWFLYIWAVNTNHIVEASLGYYINPLVSIFLAMVVLKERLNFWQLLALLFALIGVVVTTVQYGHFPWISLTLALTFGFYGLTKKLTRFEVNIGLFMETLFVMPIALIYLIVLMFRGEGSFGVAPFHINLLFMGAGVATALPLLWFAQATKRANLSTVGFAQYLAPSISLIIGVFVFNEAFTKTHIISFGFIWFALILFSFSHSKKMLELQPKYFKPKAISAESTSHL